MSVEIDNARRFILLFWRVIPLILVAFCGCGIHSRNSSYRFIVANDELYAIEFLGGYGSELAVYKTDDEGITWQATDFPKQTTHLAGNGRDLFALTSKGMLYRRDTERSPWQVIKPPAAKKEYLYNCHATADDKIIVIGNEFISVYDRSGRVLENLPIPISSSEQGFWPTLSTSEQQIVTTGGLLTVSEPVLKSWNDGLPLNPVGVQGPIQICKHGERYIASKCGDIFVADTVGAVWRKEGEIVNGKAEDVAKNICRGLISYRPESDEWLLADNQGIHLMMGKIPQRLVLPDSAPRYSLIDGITEFRGRYFVSYYRLKKGCMGVRLESDLSQGTWLNRENARKK